MIARVDGLAFHAAFQDYVQKGGTVAVDELPSFSMVMGMMPSGTVFSLYNLKTFLQSPHPSFRWPGEAVLF